MLNRSTSPRKKGEGAEKGKGHKGITKARMKRAEENKHPALPAQMNGWTGGGQASSP